MAVLVENGGGGSVTAAPIAKELLDYWILQRPNDPIQPPSAEEIKAIRAQKAAEKAQREAQEALLAEQEAANQISSDSGAAE